MFRRIFQVLAVFLVIVTIMGADSSDTRVDRIGHKLVCQCGCGQILMECNHVGCPVSPVMIAELRTQVAKGLPEAGVLSFFISKYGPISLAAPMRGGFDDVAWIVPFAVLILATLGVALLIRMWKRRQQAFAPISPAGPPASTNDALQDRIRRDTDYDSWNDPGDHQNRRGK